MYFKLFGLNHSINSMVIYFWPRNPCKKKKNNRELPQYVSNKYSFPLRLVLLYDLALSLRT